MTTVADLRPVDLLDGFRVPEDLVAATPPEGRGLRRDQVRLMVAAGGLIRHRSFLELGTELRPRDLLVINVSATLPAAVDVDEELTVHFSTPLPGGLQVVELRRGGGTRPFPGPAPHEIFLPDGGRLELLAPYPVDAARPRLWVTVPDLPEPLPGYLRSRGRPISYAATTSPHPLDAYQTIFALEPGSSEMPSAGRPFSSRLVTGLIASGIVFAPITLHTGVSSLESGEAPYPEWFEVAPATAALIDHTRAQGGRVVAVGTTVARALETTADDQGRSHPGRGWTELHITAGHGFKVVDGLITGWHEPESTHLEMLAALAGRERLSAVYAEALDRGYLWHEFGDSLLILGD